MTLDLMHLPLWSAVAVIGMVLFVIAALWPGDPRVDARLSSISGEPALNRKPARASRKTTLTARMPLAMPKFVARLLASDGQSRQRIQVRLMHAGIYSPTAIVAFPVARLLFMIVPFLIAGVLIHRGVADQRLGLIWGASGGGLGMILPSFWLDRRKVRRHAILNRSLPDALDLLVTCVEGGLSLESALQRVTEELRTAHPVLAGEMSVVQKQIEFGATPDAALRNFAERTDLESLGSLSTLLEQTRRFGTSLADALRLQAETLRADREQRAEELAQKAAVKILFPTLLFIFPTIFVVLVGPAAIQLHEVFARK